MTTDGISVVVERTLDLASQWRAAEAQTLINDPSITQTGDVAMCRLLLKSFFVLQNAPDETALRECLLAIRQLERSGYKYLLNWVYSVVGVTFGRLGSLDVGLEWVSKALIGAEDRSDEQQIRRSLCDSGFLNALLDRHEEAVLAYERALHLRNTPLSVEEEARMLNQLAEVHLRFSQGMDQSDPLYTENVGKALEQTRAATNLPNAEMSRGMMAQSLTNLGRALCMAGKLAAAEEAFKNALSHLEAAPQIRSNLYTAYARMLCDAGRFAEADGMLTAFGNPLQSSTQDDLVLEARARLAMLTGKIPEALHWSEKRLQLKEEHYRQRLAVIARNAEIFIDVERMRLSERRNKIQTGALSAIKLPVQPAQTDQNNALKDPLTGCLNRQGFAAHCDAMLIPGGRAALVLVDADNFKSINDRYGHEVGDQVLRTIGKIFTDSLRGSDLVARYDGEEFALLLHGIGSEIAWGICERLRIAVEHHGWGNVNPGLHVTVSIGVAARMNDESLSAITAIAHGAISRAKAEGRNRVIAGN